MWQFSKEFNHLVKKYICLKLSTEIFFDVWPFGGTMVPYKMNKSIIKPKGILMNSTSRKSHKVQLRGWCVRNTINITFFLPVTCCLKWQSWSARSVSLETCDKIRIRNCAAKPLGDGKWLRWLGCSRWLGSFSPHLTWAPGSSQLRPPLGATQKYSQIIWFGQSGTSFRMRCEIQFLEPRLGQRPQRGLPSATWFGFSLSKFAPTQPQSRYRRP